MGSVLPCDLQPRAARRFVPAWYEIPHEIQPRSRCWNSRGGLRLGAAFALSLSVACRIDPHGAPLFNDVGRDGDVREGAFGLLDQSSDDVGGGDELRPANEKAPGVMLGAIGDRGWIHHLGV